MINLIQGIVDFISTIATIVSSFVNGIVTVIKYIGVALVTVDEAVNYLPASLQILVLAAISAAVIFGIVGR